MQYRGYERVRDSVRRSYRHLAIAIHVPRKSQARLKEFQIVVGTRFTRKTRIARIVKTSGRIRKDSALYALFEAVVVETEHGQAVIGFREVWFPPKTVGRGES